LIPGQNNELDIVSDDIYFFISDIRSHNEFSRAPWYLKLMKQCELLKDISPSNAKDRIKIVLKQLKAAMGHH